MNNDLLLLKIHEKIVKEPFAMQAYDDYLSIVRQSDDLALPKHTHTELLRSLATAAMRSAPLSIIDRLHGIMRRTLLFEARQCRFDSYLRYIELDRKPEKRFYQPRRHYLKQVVDAYQEVADGELDFLAVSLIKRSGKSQLGINFVNMLSGKNPNKSTLMEGAGDALVKSFYKGCLEILESPEYLHYDVFPDSKLVETNADLKTINLAARNRFPTVMCRSIDATQVGLSEATNVLYLDDCVESREEAKDRNRLDKKWETISGDVLGRRIEGTPVVFSNTRYSIYDPMSRLVEKAKELGWRWKEIVVPALDPVTDNSNYVYVREGKRVFTTEYLQNERKLLSEEQWESEFQQQPFEAKGVMFPEKKLNRFFPYYKCNKCGGTIKFNERICPKCKEKDDISLVIVPDKAPDTVISVADTAESGSDSVMMPVAYIYGSDVFIPAVVFDNSPPEITKPQCAKLLLVHKVSTAVFESNNAGEYYSRDVDAIVRGGGGRTSIRNKRTISNKHTRIEMASDGVMKNFHFLDESLYERGSQYWNFIRELTTYTRTGKSAHDDAADGISLLESEVRNLTGQKLEVFRRFF